MSSPIGSPYSPYTDNCSDFALTPTSPFDKEREEVIRGSRVEWTPDILQLLRGGSKKEFPDCFDGTPIKSKLRNPKFTQDFAGIYNELLVHMACTDEELLAYGSSEREDLLVLINVFYANIGQVKQENYEQRYDDLLLRLQQRFNEQEIFVGYFPQYNDF